MSQSVAAGAPSAVAGDLDFGKASSGKIAMWIFLLTDGMSFAGLLLGYAISRAGSTSWPDPSEHLGITFTAIMTFVLICSSVTMVLALDGAQRKHKRDLCLFLFLTILGGLFFLCGQVYEYSHLIAEHISLSGGPFFEHYKQDPRFASTFFSVTGFHGMHVFTGVTYLTITFFMALKGKYTDGPNASANHVEIAGLFWHFVDLVWILVFTFMYLI